MMLIIFSDFLIVVQIFLSPQVKRSVLITNKLVYTSSPRLVKKLKILENQDISGNLTEL